MAWLAALGCALVCLAAGLGTSGSGVRDGRALLLGAVQLIGGAVLGGLIGWLFAMTPSEIAALVLIGAAPGTIAANPLVALAGGELSLAHRMTAFSGFAGVLTVAAAAVWGGGSPAGLTTLILAAALPFWLGLMLRDRLSPAAHHFVTVLAGIALAAIILAGLVLGTAGAAFWPLAGAALVLAVALTLLGHAAGLALGQGTATATTATLALPMRNVAVPMVGGLASGLTAAPLAGAVYAIAMYLPALALVFLRVSRARG